MQDGLRPLQCDRVAKCGLVRIATHVELRKRTDHPHAYFENVLVCGSVWACPTCGAKIRATRAEEVRIVVEAVGFDRVAMLTLTVAHGLGDGLRSVRAGLTNAMRRFVRGKPWTRFKALNGIVGSIRALEATHGFQNGWHPHLHVLLLLDAPVASRLDDAREWLSERWIRCVATELGPQHAPDTVHGVVLTRVHRANYLAKLGLELTAPGRGKRAKPDHRTPFEIGWDYATQRNPTDATLWRSYCEGMFRAKALTWSAGLRRRFGLGKDRDDKELVRDRAATSELLARINSQDWEVLRRDPGARAALLEIAEGEGALGVQEALAGLFGTTSESDDDWGFVSTPGKPDVD